MNKVRARLSKKHNITSVYDEVLTTLPDVIETRTVTTMYSTTTAMTTLETTRVSTTTRATTAATTTRATTTTARTTTTPTTTVSTTTPSTTTTTTTPATTTTTMMTVRTTEPNTKIFRSNNNGLSHVINRGREKMSVTTTHTPSVFLTALSEGNHRIIFEKITESTTTKRPVFLSNAKSRSPKPTISQRKCILTDMPSFSAGSVDFVGFL